MLNALKARYCNKHLCRFKVFNEFLWYLEIKIKIKLFDLYVTYFETIFIYKVVVLFPPSSWVTSATYLKSFLRQTVSNDLILPNLHECVDSFYDCQSIFNTIRCYKQIFIFQNQQWEKLSWTFSKSSLMAFFLSWWGVLYF